MQRFVVLAFRFVPITVALMALGFLAVAFADTTVVVKPTAMDGWNFQPTGTGSGGFETGPGTPPLGSGSAELKVGADTGGTDRVELRNTNYHGVLLADITAMSYDTLVTANDPGGCVAPYILLSVDVDGDGDFDPAGSPDDGLFFEPCYQTGVYVTSPPGQIIPDQCPLYPPDPLCFADGVWNSWNALTGGWWSSKYGGAGGPPLTLFSEYLNTLSGLGYNAPRIANTDNCLGGVRLRAGPGAPVWNNFEGNVDNFKIGVSGVNTIYDFEYENQPIPPCAGPATPTPLPPNAPPIAVGGAAGLLDEPPSYPQAAPATDGEGLPAWLYLAVGAMGIVSLGAGIGRLHMRRNRP